jgi:integrase
MKRVKVSICKIKKRKSPYRIRWKSRKSDKYKTQWFSNRTEADKFRKEIEHYENGFSDVSENTDLQEIRESQLLLKQTDNECANGKSIEFAVNWFIKNYQGDEEIHPLKVYYKKYQEVRVSANGRLALSLNQLKSDKQLIGFNGSKSFVNTFGDLKPTELTRELIQNYLDSNSSPYHRGKAVCAFIRWMLGESEYFNDNPCLRLNPLKGLQLVSVNKNQLREIATNQEVCDLLHLTHSEDYNYSAARWAFMFFTGVRPSECERFWNPKFKLGWNNIDLDSDKPCVIIPSEIIKKKGLSFRRIFIRNGFLKMLKEFKSKGEKVYPLRKVNNWKRVYSSARKEIWGKRLTISTNKDEAKDITRHTFITNLYRYSGNIVDVTLESGTKESTLFNHYINPLVGKDSAKDFFNLIDDSTLLSKTNTVSPKIDKSVVEELIERHGLEIDEEQEVPYIKGESFDDRTKRLVTFAKKVRLMIQHKSGVQ